MELTDVEIDLSLMDYADSRAHPSIHRRDLVLSSSHFTLLKAEHRLDKSLVVHSCGINVKCKVSEPQDFRTSSIASLETVLGHVQCGIREVVEVQARNSEECSVGARRDEKHSDGRLGPLVNYVQHDENEARAPRWRTCLIPTGSCGRDS